MSRNNDKESNINENIKNPESGASLQNQALLDVYKSVERISRGGVIFKNKTDQFLVFDKDQTPANLDNPTSKEVLSAINLSLALKEANWAYFHIDDALFHQLMLLQKNNALTNTTPIKPRNSSSIEKQQDSREILKEEIDAMYHYTKGIYLPINELLRGKSSFQSHYGSKLEHIDEKNVSAYLATALLAMSGANKNRISATSSVSEKKGSEDIDQDEPLIRLLSTVSPGLRSILSSVTGQPLAASGLQSWSYSERGSTDIKSGSVMRLNMTAQGQRPLL